MPFGFLVVDTLNRMNPEQKEKFHKNFWKYWFSGLFISLTMLFIIYGIEHGGYSNWFGDFIHTFWK